MICCGCFLGTMVCPSANSMHELSANVEVRDGDQASFEKGVDQANTGDGYVGPLASMARTRLTLRGCILLRRFRLQLRLCLRRDSFALMSCSLMRLLGFLPRFPFLLARPSLCRSLLRLLRCSPLVVPTVRGCPMFLSSPSEVPTLRGSSAGFCFEQAWAKEAQEWE